METAPGFVDRYFTRYTDPTQHVYYYQHSNGLVVAGLLRGHPALAAPPTALRFTLTPPREGELARPLTRLVSGKRKRGGVALCPGQRVCEVEGPAGRFEVRAAIRGTVIELNERLLAGETALLAEDPEEAGFLFVAAPLRGEEALGEAYPELVRVGGRGVRS